MEMERTDENRSAVREGARDEPPERGGYHTIIVACTYNKEGGWPQVVVPL